MRFLIGAFFILCGVVFLSWCDTAESSKPCQDIHFTPGRSSAELHGNAPAHPNVSGEATACFSFNTLKGQKVRLRVHSSRQRVAFNIDGLMENRDQFVFTSERRSYELYVYQTTTSTIAIPYTLTLAIQ